jgi:DNA segregation ATPase FtsK/SpoIIIE, S-DNA-T family
MEEPASAHGTVAVHRPERSFPVLPAEAVLQLAAPPDRPEPDQPGFWASALPLLGSVSAVAFAVVVHNPLYLAVAALVVVASVGGSVASRRSNRRRDRTRRQRLSAAYRVHVESLAVQARREASIQRDALEGIYPSTQALLTLARDAGSLWERRPHHSDFGAVRLGLGSIPARVIIAAPPHSGPLGDHDEELTDLAEATVRAGSSLEGAPLTIDLTSLSSIAVVGDLERGRSMVGAWVAHLATFHAPGELRFLGWVPPSAADRWDWTKWLPHTIDPLAGGGTSPSALARSSLAMTVDPDEFAHGLHRLITARDRLNVSAGERGRPVGFRVSPGHAWVVVIVDGYAPDAVIASDPALDHALSAGHLLGVTVVALCADDAAVPVTCSARVDLELDGTCTYRPSGADPRPASGILAELLPGTAPEELARWLAPRRIARGESGALSGGPVRLSDLLGATEGATGSSDLLGVPVGRTDDAQPLVLDINEAAAGGHGPHGVLVGATGSGKSELLRSFVAGLAARHPPSVLTALLIDFKGGAAFAELAALPHTVGVITNLADDTTLIERVQVSLVGELERRQQLLGASGHASIRTYRRADPGSGPETLPYLVVVVDEFGELLTARPEFLDTFVQIGRLGRSLGVHLLLASQRLDEGRLRGLESHLRYRLALQTFTASESIAVLGSSAAYELPAVPGVGYFKVDSTVTRFQAALATLPARRESDDDHGPMVQPFVLGGVDRGHPRPTPATTGADSMEEQTELQALVQELVARGHPQARPVWTHPLPHPLSMHMVGYVAGPRTDLRAAVGLIDEPARQCMTPLVVDLLQGGHVGLVGGARSGRSSFLCTLTRALAADHDPTRLQIYGIDHGGGGLTSLAALPHAGAVVGRHEPESVLRLLAEMGAVARERASTLRDAGLSTLDELVAHEGAVAMLPHPFRAHVLLLVDNVGQLRAEHPDAEGQLVELAATGLPLGIHLALTASRWLEFRPALLDALSVRLELRLGDPSDSDVGRSSAAAVPPRAGRGLTRDGRHFQLATAPVGHPVATSPLGHRAPRVAPLPALVHPPGDVGPEEFALGIEEHRWTRVQLDLLAPGAHLLVHGDSGSGRTALLRRVVSWVCDALPPDRVQLHLVDPGRSLVGLAGLAQVADYAYEPSRLLQLVEHLSAELGRRRPPPGLALDQLVDRSWWRGPEHVLVVDDYDQLIRPDGSPLSPLVDALPRSVDLGWHVVLARRVSGASRTAFDPFGQRLRELGPFGLVLSGDPGEGSLFGGVTAAPMPPGRGRLVRPGRETVLVQTYLPPPGEE